MHNKMTDLRNHLFETLEALKDPDAPMDVARAKAISEVAGQVIDLARVELEFMDLVNADAPSDFFPGRRLEIAGDARPAMLLPGRKAS